jgi:hypothetical protein
MKKIFLFFFLLLPILAFSQIDKIGYSKSKLVSSMQGDPCKTDYNGVWYCLANGSFVKYTIENDYVTGVFYMWEFSSKYEADADVRLEISKESAQFGKPDMKGDDAFWLVDDLVVLVKYGFTNGKHYSTLSYSKRN